MGLIKGLKDSFRIAIKDLTEFERNRMGLMFLFLMPFFMLIMTGYIFPTGSSYTNIPVAIVDQDNSTLSHMIISQLQAADSKSNLLDISYASSVDAAKANITGGKIEGAIVIPSGLDYNVTHQIPTNITIYSDNSIPQESMIIQEMGTQLVNGLSNGVATMSVVNMLNVSHQTVSSSAAEAIVDPLIPNPQGTVPGTMNYFSFVAPGLLMMIVMMGAMTGIPRAVAHEKEIGTFDGILSAPVNDMSIIFGKTLAQTIRGFIQGIIVLIIAILLFGVTINGSLPLAFFVLFLGIFSFIGLGILLTSLANNEETAQILMMVLQFPMMFLTGVFFPIQQMPWFMQDLSKILPLTYAVTAMRKVMVMGAGPQDILTEMAILIVFGAIMLIIAIPVFRRSMTR